MAAVVIDGPGTASVLRTGRVATPSPINAELLIQVRCASVNPLDCKTRAGGGVSDHITSFPAVLGYDFSGVVVRSPYAAHPLAPGTEVFGMTATPRYDGSYAEYVVAPVGSVAPKPASLSHAEAAATPLAALTAWGLVVDTARAHRGQRILIHAAAGGVGHFAVQFARYFGAEVIATASAENHDWLRVLGADECVDYRTERFEDVVAPVDVVIDLVGNVHDDTGTRSLDVLRPGGLLINVPTNSWTGFEEAAAARGLRATGYKVSPDGDTLESIGRLMSSGSVRPYVDRVYRLDEATAAHEHVESGHSRGKVVLSVGEA
ncbi:NADP-dependent oxidoreductase [Mycetocola reblochoni]|uniref:NADP-dependent oxidoreductase n=2 Tax=Mycetocola reblochoni TaxID=331618 RepID=A0A3L6ZT12_9MICO|nr:NADP-dependent oxidoreductase [Mycetocola reblochoni]